MTQATAEKNKIKQYKLKLHNFPFSMADLQEYTGEKKKKFTSVI